MRFQFPWTSASAGDGTPCFLSADSADGGITFACILDETGAICIPSGASRSLFRFEIAVPGDAETGAQVEIGFGSCPSVGNR